MDGFWFYWFMWLFIIWNAFFNENINEKNKWMYMAPLIIISTSILVPLNLFHLRLTWIIGMILVFSLIARLAFYKKIRLYMISLLVSAGYFMVHYYIYFEPVWLFVSPLTITISISSFISILLIKDPRDRLTVLGAGFVQADFVLWFNLWNNSHPYAQQYTIGDFPFLDMLALSLLIVFVWNSLEKTMINLRNKWFVNYDHSQPMQKKINY